MSRTAPPDARPTRPAAGEHSKRALAEQARKRQRRLIGATVAAVVLVAVAVFAVQRATPGPQALTSASSGGSSSSANGPAEVGQPVPDFRLVTVDGAPISPDRLRGSDAILWFTTTYCVPCQIGAQKYQALDKELGDNAPTMVFVFLDPQEPDAALSGFRDKFGLPQWQMAMDTDQLAQRAGVQVLDTKIFVDEKGVVRDINTPPVNDDYLASIRRLATGA